MNYPLSKNMIKQAGVVVPPNVMPPLTSNDRPHAQNPQFENELKNMDSWLAALKPAKETLQLLPNQLAKLNRWKNQKLSQSDSGLLDQLITLLQPYGNS